MYIVTETASYCFINLECLITDENLVDCYYDLLGFQSSWDPQLENSKTIDNIILSPLDCYGRSYNYHRHIVCNDDWCNNITQLSSPLNIIFGEKQIEACQNQQLTKFMKWQIIVGIIGSFLALIVGILILLYFVWARYRHAVQRLQIWRIMGINNLHMHFDLFRGD